jgi:hypothetical protein
MSEDAALEEKDFPDVELEPTAKAKSSFFLESNASISILGSLVLLAGFIALHTYAALRAPPYLITQSGYYARNKSVRNADTIFNVQLTVSELLNEHRFVRVKTAMITDDISEDRAFVVNWSSRNNLQRGYFVVQKDIVINHTLEFLFKSGEPESSYLQVANCPLLDMDKAEVGLTFKGDFTRILGANLIWTVGNPDADEYVRSFNLKLSFACCYLLVIFAYHVKFDSESFSVIYMLIVGITGVFFSNPLHHFFPDLVPGEMLDDVFLSLYLGFYRMFLIVQLELLRANNSRPGFVQSILIGSFFAIFTIADSAARFDRRLHTLQLKEDWFVKLGTEIARAGLHLIYAIGGLVYLYLAYLRHDGAHPRRLAFFGFSIVLMIAVGLFTDVFCLYARIWEMTPKLDLLQTGIAVALSSQTLFLFHSSGDWTYEGIDSAKESGHHVIELDQISDDEGRNAKDDDDTEEEDGEEE